MSGPSFVVLPVSGNVDQQSNQQTAEIASTVRDALYERSNPKAEQPGPFKQMLAHTDSLYKYINWEDPIRTLGLYIGALSILFGAHYLPLTSVALKAGVTVLGGVSVMEFASRLLTANSLSSRLRPKEYKMIPESTLNATLKDIHDLIQYAVVQVQRIVFGQDLEKTFAAFLGCTALFWLTSIIPAFWLAVMGVTSIFVAPLVSSPQGRRVAHDASVRSQEVANTAAEKGKVLAQNGKAKTAELSSSGQQTATDLSAQARDTASNMSGTAAENIRKLPQLGTNTINGVKGMVNSAFGNSKGPISTPPSNNINRNSDGNRSFNDGAVNRVSQPSNGAGETARQMAPEVYTDKPDKPNKPDNLQNWVSFQPSNTGGARKDSFADTEFQYPVAGDPADKHSMQNRPRGTAQAYRTEFDNVN